MLGFSSELVVADSTLLYVAALCRRKCKSDADILNQVSVGMMVVGAVPYVRGCLVIVSQILGAIAASALVSCMLPGPLNVRTSLGGGTSVVQGLFIEVGTYAFSGIALFQPYHHCCLNITH